jgi:NhaP-type Na+/H+ or K+/H+ antiporter
MEAEHHLLISLASIVVLGMGAQWIAWRLGVPSILFLLLAGFVAGPITGFLDPDHLFGELLFPIVSLSVAVILFEGGMSLKLKELRDVGHVVRNLVSIGALVTWLICSVAAVLIFQLPIPIAMLLGAILVVTGPTVTGPILRAVRPSGQVGTTLKWEGIVIDPVGASLAVLVFEVIIAGEFQAATAAVAEGLARTVIGGGLLGLLGAALIVIFLRRYWLPDFLQNPVALMVVISVFTASNFIQEESGLLAVTVMGVALANQPFVVVRNILQFKEDLRVLLIATLFIVLTARVPLERLESIGLQSLLFLGIVMLVARPIAVALSTMQSSMSWRERLFLSWIAPRGIVAASVASLFAIRMAEADIEGARQLVPITFTVIVGTVAIYSLTALPVARWLGVARPNPQGVLIVGAHTLARMVGHALQKQKFQVLLVDTNPVICEEARAEGLPVFHGSIFAPEVHERIALGSIGRLLAITANDEVNAFAVQEWTEMFGSAEVYQLSPHEIAQTQDARATLAPSVRGRLLFGRKMTYTHLMERIYAGATIETITLPDASTNTLNKYLSDQNAVPLFAISEDRSLHILTANRTSFTPRTRQTLIRLVNSHTTQSYDAAPIRDLEQLRQSV